MITAISDALGAATWFNCILAFTHSASAPPDGPGGIPQGWDAFIQHRASALLNCIR